MSAPPDPALEALFCRCYADLSDFLLTGPSAVSPLDVAPLMIGLAKRLPEYAGLLSEGEFIEWARPILQRGSFMVNMVRQNRDYVRGALHKVLVSATDLLDLGYAIDEGEARVWAWVLESKTLTSLMEPGTATAEGRPPATISTRLSGRARWVGRAMKTEALRARQRDLIHLRAAKLLTEREAA